MREKKSGFIWEPREVRKHFVVLCKVGGGGGGGEVITEDNIRE